MQICGYFQAQSSNPLLMHSTRPSLTPASETSSHIDPQRSSSTSLAQEPYSRGQTYNGFDHLKVMGESLQWQAGLDNSAMFSMSHVLGSTVVTSEPSYSDFLPGSFYPKQRSSSIPCKISNYSGPDVGMSVRFDSGSGGPSTPEGQTAQTTLTNERPQRKITTTEEADYECTVEGCGKLFNRRYNYRAHVETHDSERIYPWTCPLLECDKRFAERRTCSGITSQSI
jgi:hypothetical protein